MAEAFLNLHQSGKVRHFGVSNFTPAQFALLQSRLPFTLATNQVDFAVPSRFDLKFTNSKGESEVPLCIHRAPLSTHERMIGFLLEHFAGNFPLWLSPLQVKIIPITDAQHDYAKELLSKLKEEGIRAEIDSRPEKMQAKIRDAQLEKVPYMLVIGQREIEANSVAVRQRDGQDLGALSFDEFLAKVKEQINTKSLNLIK